jgi:hypothetical protein
MARADAEADSSSRENYIVIVQIQNKIDNQK